MDTVSQFPHDVISTDRIADGISAVVSAACDFGAVYRKRRSSHEFKHLGVMLVEFLESVGVRESESWDVAAEIIATWTKDEHAAHRENVTFPRY